MHPKGRWFTNRYFITGTAFVLWLLFFDKNDLWLQLKRTRELSKLQKSEQVMEQRMAGAKQELGLLKTDPQTLEKFAREKYLMKRDNEDLFLVSTDSSSVR
ncbi:MAG: septum formation initiator family protein [Bacteroidota bacterium]|nr:septum formation initiator family protein [Bacteroidota bacterium]